MQLTSDKGGWQHGKQNSFTETNSMHTTDIYKAYEDKLQNNRHQTVAKSSKAKLK